MSTPKKRKTLGNAVEEYRFIFRISKSKLICAKPEEMINYKLRLGSLCEKYKVVRI